MNHLIKQELEAIAAKWSNRIDSLRDKIANDPLLEVSAVDTEFSDWFHGKIDGPKNVCMRAFVAATGEFW